MLKYLILLFFFLLNNAALAIDKNKIIQKLSSIENFVFEFRQTTNQKSEEGTCFIKYPKKIYCEYNNINKKILVSNGKLLAIKNTVNSKSYYLYSLKKTPLEYILNKDYLIKKIKNLEPRNIDDQYINFKINENDNEINIFFDIKSLNLIGWQTEDVYQNLSITFISSLKTNQNISNQLFKIPDRE